MTTRLARGTAGRKSRQIKRQSVPETLRESLQERILSGEIREGDWLIQDAIAEEYDVSRMPVREALRQLEACGLVLMRTHRGAIVTSIPTEQVEELFELRAALECEVLRRALASMTDRDIAEARTLLSQLDASYGQGDIGSWGRLNWAFHRRLYEPAGRIQTLNILQGINLQIERYVRLPFTAPDPGSGRSRARASRVAEVVRGARDGRCGRLSPAAHPRHREKPAERAAGTSRSACRLIGPACVSNRSSPWSACMLKARWDGSLREA